jgi:hypothetical protein
METLTEQKAIRRKPLLQGTNPSYLSRLAWVKDQILGLAIAFDRQLTAQRIAIYVESLADLSDEQVARAVQRSIRESKFFPTIAELRDFAGLNPTSNADAEARAAWDTLLKYVSRHVLSNPYGSYYADGGVLDQRIADSARRSGGWAAFKTMTPKEFPFLQKRFFEEYTAWSEVQRIFELRPMLAQPTRKLLEMPRPPEGATQVEPKNPSMVLKPIPAPLTDAQLRDRREMLQQQRAQVLKRGAR